MADPRLPDPLDDVHTVIENSPVSLYVVNTDGSGGAWWCPTLKDVADDGIAWSPDGNSLAVLSQTPKIGFHYIHTDIDVCSASGSHHVATLDNAGANIAWINGGKDLVFLSTTTQVLTPDHVWTVPASGGTPQDQTPTLPASAIHLFGDAHGNVWVNVARGVQTEIDSFQNNALTTTYKWADGTVDDGVVATELASAPDVRVLTVSDPQHTSNVAAATSGGLQKITHEGDEQLAKIALGDMRAVRWKSKEGIDAGRHRDLPGGLRGGQEVSVHGAASRRVRKRTIRSISIGFTQGLCRHGLRGLAAGVSRLDRLWHASS